MKINLILTRILLHTVTVQACSWELNSCDYFSWIKKGTQGVCYWDYLSFVCTDVIVKKGVLSFEFSLIQFRKAVRHDAQCVFVCVQACVCVCFLINKNIYNLLQLETKHLRPHRLKHRCINIKYSAFYQLWEVVCIIVKIQILHSK